MAERGLLRPSLRVADWRARLPTRRLSLDALAALVTILCTCDVAALLGVIARSQITQAMAFLLGIVVMGLVVSRRSVLVVGALLCVACYDFFFVSPRLTLVSDESGYPAVYLLLLFVGLLMSLYMANFRDLLKLSMAQSVRTGRLLETSRLLQACGSEEQIVEACGQQLARMLEAPVAIFPCEGGELGAPRPFLREGGSRPPDDVDAARLALCEREPVGAGCERLPECPGSYLPVLRGGEVFAVIGLAVPARGMDSEALAMARAVTGDMRLALERNAALDAREAERVRAEAERTKSVLLRSISHDLRTPLTAIIGNADLLLSGSVDVGERDRDGLLRDIRDDAAWLSEVVENLLTMTRMGDGVAFRREPELLDDIILEAVQLCSRHAQGHEIRFEPPSEVIVCSLDACVMTQVVVNLINNALTYTPTGGVVSVTVGRAPGATDALVSVLDEGPGIPDAQKEAVFEAFYTLDPRRPDGRRGVGLGLALCKAIVEAHGGTIWVEDRLPRGAAFRFTLSSQEVESA